MKRTPQTTREEVSWEIREGDVFDRLREMPDESVQTVITSPPYWGLRDYGVPGQLGLEETPAEYVANMVGVFAEVRRVLRDDGTLWLNLGDSYTSGGRKGRGTRVGHKQQTNRGMNGTTDPARAPQPPGLKPKDLVGIPWMVAFALRADGWYLRSEIIWAKPNPMPESVKDRPTKAHEQVFLLTKSPRYFYDADAVREPHAHPKVTHVSKRQTDAQKVAFLGNAPTNLGRAGNHKAGRNKRTVWTVTPQPFGGAHFATFPPKLIEPMVLAGSKPGDTVLDPFSGSGTTGTVALRHVRSYIGIELNPEYAAISRDRIRDDAPTLNAGIEVAT